MHKKLQPTCQNGSIVQTFTHAKISTFTVDAVEENILLSQSIDDISDMISWCYITLILTSWKFIHINNHS